MTTDYNEPAMRERMEARRLFNTDSKVRLTDPLQAIGDEYLAESRALYSVDDPTPGKEKVDMGSGEPLMPAFQDNARGRVLAMAERCVNRDRNASYGDPNQDFARTSGYWNIHLFGVVQRKLMESGYALPLDPVVESVLREITDTWDVGIMIGQMKDSRLAWSPGHLDNWVDKGGYTACGVDCAVAAGLIDVNTMDPVGGRVVDPPQMPPEVIPLQVPQDFDRMNQMHILQLLQQTPPADGTEEPRPDQVQAMTVAEYANRTGRLAAYNSFMEQLYPELGDDDTIEWRDATIGDALKRMVGMSR